MDKVAPDRRQVGVRVDEAGEEHATVEIDHLGVDAFEEPHLVAPTEADDRAVPHGDGLVGLVGSRKRVYLPVHEQPVRGVGHGRVRGWQHVNRSGNGDRFIR